jgi:hypothetical protein
MAVAGQLLQLLRRNKKHKWKGYKRNQKILDEKTESAFTNILGRTDEFSTQTQFREGQILHINDEARTDYTRNQGRT